MCERVYTGGRKVVCVKGVHSFQLLFGILMDVSRFLGKLCVCVCVRECVCVWLWLVGWVGLCGLLSCDQHPVLVEG